MRKSSLNMAAMLLSAVAGLGFPALPSSIRNEIAPIRSKRKITRTKDPLFAERQTHNQAVEQKKRDRLAAREAKRMAGMTEVV